MISEFLNPNFTTDLNLAANTLTASLAPRQLKISKDSLDVAIQTLDISVKLYNEFEETHNVEDQRYYKTEIFQEKQLELMQGILTELVKLNGNTTAPIESTSTLSSQHANQSKRMNAKMLQPNNFIYENDLVSQNAFNAHIQLYQNYVNQVNSKISESQLDTYNFNGALLHELFFEQLTKQNNLTSKTMIEFFDINFNGYENWKENITDLAMKVRSKGWVATIYCPLTNSYKNIMLNSHDENIPLGIEIIILGDFFEHAYWHDYFTEKKDYIEMFFKCINWSVVEKRFEPIYKQASLQ